MPFNSDLSLEQKFKFFLEDKIQEPKLYRVVLHNDHYTSMDFVVEVLKTIFAMPAGQAEQVMLMVHTEGKGECGIYPYDLARTKVSQVNKMSRDNEYPLKCSYEPA